MPPARRRRQSGRHRAHDELFGPAAGRSVASGGRRLGDDADTAGRPLDAIAHFERVLAADALDVDCFWPVAGRTVTSGAIRKPRPTCAGRLQRSDEATVMYRRARELTGQ